MNMNMNTQNTQTRSSRSTLFAPNPLVKKLSKLTETSETHVTYKGISNKCIFYVCTIVLGVLLAFILQNTGTALNIENIAINENLTLNTSTITLAGMAGLMISLLIFLITPFLAFLINKTIPVTGSLYCMSTGYIYSYLAIIFVQYQNAVVLALFITAAVCISMFLLYRSGIIRVGKRFQTVLFTLLISMALISLVVLICSFIPVPAVQAISHIFTGSGPISILFSVLGVVAGTMFLISDFALVDESVENQLPKKYEWYCAFSLAFSVIWLYLKILDLLLKVLSKSNSSH